MKKFTIAAIILSVCLMFVGCTTSIESELTTVPIDISEEESIVEETLVEAEESEISVEDTFPDAKEFPEIEWPTFGAATKVPTPTWSNRGEFLGTSESESYLWVQVGYSSLNDFSNYIKLCQDWGYTENAYIDYDCLTPIYYGEDESGCAIQLTYNTFDYYMAIQYTADTSDWSKWWEEETSTTD